MPRIHTIAGYQPYHVTLPETVRSRYCPGMRSCWSFSFISYNPFNRPTFADSLRRVCMILTLASRTLLDLLELWYNIAGAKVLNLVISLILGLIGFFFMGFCLATIGSVEGERVVIRWKMGRWHFDAFLLTCALIHVSLLVSYFVGIWADFIGLAFGTTGVIMWILIVAVAWICTWDPVPVSMA